MPLRCTSTKPSGLLPCLFLPLPSRLCGATTGLLQTTLLASRSRAASPPPPPPPSPPHPHPQYGSAPRRLSRGSRRASSIATKRMRGAAKPRPFLFSRPRLSSPRATFITPSQHQPSSSISSHPLTSLKRNLTSKNRKNLAFGSPHSTNELSAKSRLSSSPHASRRVLSSGYLSHSTLSPLHLLPSRRFHQ